ncbi:MAG: A/G-specific adenine glycosylase [Patescibacteria group bacterium UBA2103]
MEQKTFKKKIYSFYKKEGRDLPWRRTKNPYRIWVSEVMLQQTQVSRVIPKYKEFLKKFPTINALAKAPLKDVLITWQGLGYNRRAKLLHEGAKYIEKEYKGIFPKNDLQKISGIGPYTEAAIQAFAFNKAIPCIETNIRTVYTHYFFEDKKDVTDKEILKIVEETLDKNNPREWYWALMDHGSYLKQQGVQVNSKSKHYVKQSKFKGSDREIRGAIVRVLSKGGKIKDLSYEKERMMAQVEKLKKEGMVVKKGRGLALAT